MNLKQIVLESVSHRCLKRLSTSLDAKPKDLRSKASICRAIKKLPHLTTEELLDRLRVEELKGICREYDLRPRGRRAELISLLLEHDQRTKRRTSSAKPMLQQNNAGRFVAIDFETAHSQLDSACAVALVTVEGDRIVDRSHFYIRPPREKFGYHQTRVHGITWSIVADAPNFGDLWPTISTKIEGASFLVAHRAAFDRSVLNACCRTYKLTPPEIPFECTLERARRIWRLDSHALNVLCSFLKIPLKNHHNALDDAEACAKIMILVRNIESELDP